MGGVLCVCVGGGGEQGGVSHCMKPILLLLLSGWLPAAELFVVLRLVLRTGPRCWHALIHQVAAVKVDRGHAATIEACSCSWTFAAAFTTLGTAHLPTILQQPVHYPLLGFSIRAGAANCCRGNEQDACYESFQTHAYCCSADRLRSACWPDNLAQSLVVVVGLCAGVPAACTG